MDANHLDLTVYNPMKLSSEARVLSLHGQGISGGNAAQPTFYAADRINNLQPATNYVYHGGTVTPPGGIYLGGSGGNGLFDYALADATRPRSPRQFGNLHWLPIFWMRGRRVLLQALQFGR